MTPLADLPALSLLRCLLIKRYISAYPWYWSFSAHDKTAAKVLEVKAQVNLICVPGAFKKVKDSSSLLVQV
jgi:hypothetical protein